jgi:Ca2+-binding RTX toxin-like protein
MTFSLTAGKKSVLSQEDKISSLKYERLFEDFLKDNPAWLEDKGFGGIQSQVITPSTNFPELEFSNPGKARGFDFWFDSLANDSGAVAEPGQVITGVKGQSDKLIGTDDDDVFMVNDKGDRVVTGQKGASDSVMTQEFNLDLRSKQWDGIENAILAGSKELNLTGDAGANILSGNGADNVIRGGAGIDTLFGGGGEDVFVITRESKKTFDQIIDFESGEDKIALSGSAFRSLFDKNKLLKDGVIDLKLKLDDQGILWFDSDGTGKKAAVEIALIGVTDALDKTDFIFI